MRRVFLSGILMVMGCMGMAQTKTVKLRIVETSDVHGCFFPYDFINRQPLGGTLARVSTYVNRLRKEYGDRLILLDNGDILQGQPTCYYCNYVKPNEPNVAASVVNYMGYDAQTFGNHDVETGHAVYDKWVSEVKCPVIGANIVSVKTGEPYVKPYALLCRDGVKIAVLGMLTPAIPHWLNEELWSGLRFEEMVASSRKWIDYLKREVKPDIIIGLFHSGRQGGITTDGYEEDASLRVARQVPGFDLILYGHDHTLHQETVKNVEGQDVLCLDPSTGAFYVADAEIVVETKESPSGQHFVRKTVNGQLVNVADEAIDRQMVNHFQAEIDSISAYVNREIGTFSQSVYTRDCYFGSAAFTDFIHDVQLKITGADISFNAPLAFDTGIKAGPVRVSDLFNLYKYENEVYVLRMTGEEIRRHLEMSYDLWVNTMMSKDDHIMQLSEWTKDDKQRYGFKNLAFNFDSAAGIDYEVDVTKPDGQKVRILGMSDGRPFSETEWYRVAMNSYRGNGGGELLTRGAGIPREQLKARILWRSPRDQRHYLMCEIQHAGIVTPCAHDNWRFVPEEWTHEAIERDRKLIFGNE